MTLNEFYRSSAWEKLTTTLKLERVDKDGNIICAHCGKPIVKAYDCICHHKEYLTEENVTDPEIALNPDNIDLVHHKCHNLIHNRFGFERRHVYLVYGSPLSGKSTYVDENKSPEDLIIDINRIWQCVSANEYAKPNKLKSVVFALRDDLMDMVRVRRGKWDTAYIVGGFPLVSERERIVKETGAEMIFIDTPKEECLKRLESIDASRSAEMRDYIENWWRLYQ